MRLGGTETSIYKHCVVGGGGSSDFLPCKYENLGSDAQNPCQESDEVVHVCNPSTPMERWKAVMENAQKPTKLGSLAHTTVNKRLSQTREKGKTIQDWPVTMEHMGPHSHKHAGACT